MNKGNHLMAPALLNPVEFDGIGECTDGFQAVDVQAKEQEVVHGF